MDDISTVIEKKMYAIWEETGAGHYRARMNRWTRDELRYQMNRMRWGGAGEAPPETVDVVSIANSVGLVSFEADESLPDGHVEVEALQEDDDGEEIQEEA